MIKFELNGTEYIELNKLLKLMNLVGTGGEANIRIIDGEVKINGVEAFEKRKKIRAGDKVFYNGETIAVS